jgi:hypothetical protein
VLAGISLVALGLRVWNLNYGLPGVFNMDERPILDRALTFAKGDPNPHNFLYPTLYLYAIFAWEALYFVVGRGLGSRPADPASPAAETAGPREPRRSGRGSGHWPADRHRPRVRCRDGKLLSPPPRPLSKNRPLGHELSYRAHRLAGLLI